MQASFLRQKPSFGVPPTMATPRSLQWLLWCLTACVFLGSVSCASDDLEIVKMERKIDLHSQIVRLQITFTVRNAGTDAAGEVYLGLPTRQVAGLGFLRAAAVEGGRKDEKYVGLEAGLVRATEGAPDNVTFVRLTLPEALPPGGRARLEVYVALSKQLTPFPAEIGQQDKLLVLFSDTHFAIVPYAVKEQTTSVTLAPSSSLLSYTEKAPVKTSGQSFRLGPFLDVPPMAASPMDVHYSFPAKGQLLVAESLLREVEISHWGNIYVTEHYTVRNDGARHKGPFSRLDFDAPLPVGNGAVRSLYLQLPLRAHSVYYRDEIGNISSSHFLIESLRTGIYLDPRYPLLGGWSVSFTIGYSVPLGDFVFRTADGRRALNMTFGSQIHDIVVESLVTKVILPEGSTKVQAFGQFSMEQSLERRFTYLDVRGRPVVVLRRENVVAEYAGLYFQVVYKFAGAAQLVEPLLLVAAFAAFFTACVAYVRCDFPISKATPAYQAQLQRELVVDLLQQLQRLLAARAAAGERLSKSLHQLARSGDTAAAKAARRAEEASLKESGREARALVEQLEGLPKPPPVLPKVQALVAKEKETQDKLLQKHAVTLEAFERQLAPKDIDSRVLPIQQKLTQLKLEVRDLTLALEE